MGNSVEYLKAIHPSDTKASFVGPIYILRSEDADKWQLFLDKTVQCIQLFDIVEEDWVYQYVHNALMIRRYDHAVSLVIERKVVTGQLARLERAKERKRRHEARLADMAQKLSDRPEDVGLLHQLQRHVEEAVEAVDAAAKERPDDFAYSLAFENSADSLEMLDTLIAHATRRRDDALECLFMWREGFGRRLRETAGTAKTIDADNEALPELPAPPVSPAE